MRFKYVFLFLFIMGGFALPVFSIAEQAPNKQHWREKVLGTMEGYQLTAAKFARFMIAMGYVEERERLVKEELIHQEAAKRGVAVGSAEVDKALEEYVASFIQQSDADNFTDLLRMNRMTETMVREQVRLRLALKQMVLADTDVKEELIANEIPLWLDKLAANAKIVRYSLKKNQPLVRAASVNDKDISVLALVHELLKRYSDEELGDLLQEVMDYQMVRLHLESIGEPLTEEDLLAEFERLKKEVAEDPQFNGVPLVDILAAQKKSIEDLFNEPGFRLRAMVRKACDSKTDVTTEQLRRYFRENYLDFIDRKLTIRVISIYHKNPNGQPIEGMSPAASLARAKEIRAEIAEGLSFADAAARYAQDKELQKTGGLVGSKLTMDSRIFLFLPELLTVFKAEKGDIVGPVKTEYGAHLVKVENVEDKPFEQVQGKVRRSFMEQKRKNWVENLRAQMKASHVGAKGMLEVYLPQIDW